MSKHQTYNFRSQFLRLKIVSAYNIAAVCCNSLVQKNMLSSHLFTSIQGKTISWLSEFRVSLQNFKVSCWHPKTALKNRWFNACIAEISICFHSGWHCRCPATLGYVTIMRISHNFSIVEWRTSQSNDNATVAVLRGAWVGHGPPRLLAVPPTCPPQFCA